LIKLIWIETIFTKLFFNNPGNLILPTMASQWLSEKSVHRHMATAHFSTEASDVDHPTGHFGTLFCTVLAIT